MLPAQPNQSLMDGIACLQALATCDAPVGSRELARRLGLEATRANRLLKTLAHLGLARQGEDRRYQSGPAMHVLSIQSLRASGLIRRAVPVLESLHSTGHTVALGVLWRNQVSYLYHGRTGVPASEAIGGTGIFPASQSAIGLVLLSQMPIREVGKLYAKGEVPGFTSLAALQTDIRRAREGGFAVVVHGEYPVHASLAIPLGGDTGAAIALAGVIHASDYPRLVQRLQVAAGKIAAAPDP